MNDKTSDENKSIQNCKLAIKTFYKEKYLTGYYFDKSNGMAMGLESNPF